MSIPLYQIDAFTSDAFAGNPAAVCILPMRRDPEWMLKVAREMNLSETAFLVKRPEAAGGEGGFDLRWFTPEVEIALCGHATLASAHALWESGQVARGKTARFHTMSGLLTADRRGEWIELNFPATLEQAAEPPAGLLAALGVTPRYVGKSRFDYLVEVESEAVVKDMRPDFVALRALPVRGVMVTSPATSAGCDFVSRFFAPGSGIDEDPVTGSAHCCLTPYWSRKLGKTEFIARQLSARGGLLRLKLEGDRVKLAGQAVTIFKGELLV